MNLSPPDPSKATMLKPLIPALKLPMRLLLVSALVAAMSVPVFALRAGSRAPEIGLRDIAGRPVRMASLRNKVVLVDFFASWCRPCREEMPVLERLHDEYGRRGLVIVAVNIDTNRANMDRFLRQVPVSFRVVHDPQHQVADRYDPPAMPSSYLIDKRGVVRHVHSGFRASDAAALEREIQALLR